MGKIILEFDSIEEQDDARSALDGYKWKIAVWDIDQFLRSTTKYNTPILALDGEATNEEVEVAVAIREEICKILDSYNLKLD
jgi:hypothetical protein